MDRDAGARENKFDAIKKFFVEKNDHFKASENLPKVKELSRNSLELGFCCPFTTVHCIVYCAQLCIIRCHCCCPIVVFTRLGLSRVKFVTVLFRS